MALTFGAGSPWLPYAGLMGFLPEFIAIGQEIGHGWVLQGPVSPPPCRAMYSASFSAM